MNDAAQPAAAGTPDPTLLRIPADLVREGDGRSLGDLQEHALQTALQLEEQALAREEELLPASDAVRRTRLEAARTWVAELRMNAYIRAADHTLPSSAVAPIDRFVWQLAADRLGTAFPGPLLEPWMAANEEFLAGGQAAARERAKIAREAVFKESAALLALSRALATIRQGPLDAETRAALIASLREALPDAPLPGQGAGAALAGAAAGLGAGGQPGEALPRLDGVEAPVAEVPDLRQLLQHLPRAR